MEVGEYIRINGIFDKIKKIDLEYESVKCEHGRFWLDDIHKHSFNIVDLIEIGDYVNGKEVVEIIEHTIENITNRKLVCIGGSLLERNNDIQTILPHEWVECGTYHIKEEK